MCAVMKVILLHQQRDEESSVETNGQEAQPNNIV
jgi:hypothetical protein